MPGPGGQYFSQFYESPTSGGSNSPYYGVPGYQRVNDNLQQLSGSSGHSGSFGAGALGLFSSVANSALDTWRFYDQLSFNRQEAAKQRAFESNEAAQQRAFERAETRFVNRQNSAAGQVDSMKAAGMSPGVMYGQMFSTAAQPAIGSAASGGSAASSPSAPKSDMSDMSSSYLRSLELSNEQKLQSAQIDKMNVERLRVEIDNMTAHQSNIADLELKYSQVDKNSAEGRKILEMLELEKSQLLETIENIKASTSNLDASTTYLAGAKTSETRSRVSLNNANARQANANADYTAGALTDKTIEETNTAYQQGRVYKHNANEIALRYGLSVKKVDFISDILSEHGFDSSYLPYAVDFADNLAKQSGQSLPDVSLKTLASWFSGNNWIPFISRSFDRSNDKDIAESYQQTMKDIASGHDDTQLEIASSYIDAGYHSDNAKYVREQQEKYDSYKAEFSLLTPAEQNMVKSYRKSLSEHSSGKELENHVLDFVHSLYIQNHSNRR